VSDGDMQIAFKVSDARNSKVFVVVVVKVVVLQNRKSVSQK
jgi:hypothetical protein